MISEGKTIKLENIEDAPYISVDKGKLKIKGNNSMTDTFWVLVQRLNPSKSLDKIKSTLGVI